ncbi:hypothetical protein V495_00239 [Pseudogymnoascus sp. VKM F-4514 (FW-929)]|nr:hypothetical protein V495_00239 [Pseudogymnoascus sp. VKM F-4514 (FW-929)]KFY67198.1 hypothetical protein V497_00505 [Pseudogymnoascus sp. VKM F-4516 (FW-969)]
METLADILHSLGISKYLGSFIAAGFLTWTDLLDITEAELESLDVKRGHRRKLQRRIATERGFPRALPLHLLPLLLTSDSAPLTLPSLC